MNLPSGRSKQEFPDVSAQIRPETVTLTGPGIGIVEQNFDYDLLTPATLMEKAVGQTITLLRINPATGAETRLRAKVLAANDGVVLQIGDTIEVLRDDGLPVRVIFDKVPPNLRARPTLSVTLESKGGVTPTTLTYLTPELGWTSDYVTLFDDAKQTIDVQGWVTLTNNTGTDYTNADVLLVANNPNQGGGRRSFQTPYNPSTGTMDEAGTQSNDRERLGDYYLYPLSERTTISNAQQKQVSFLDVKAAPARSTYEFNNGWLASNDAASASSVLKFSTSRGGGLGDQLPSGIMRVYMRDNFSVDRSGSKNFVQTIIDEFAKRDEFILIIAPEGRRGAVTRWKTGFYHMALGAGVPLVVGVCDYGRKEVGLRHAIMPTGDYAKDVTLIMGFYNQVVPRHPLQSSVDFGSL
jgi:hypothetical protein